MGTTDQLLRPPEAPPSATPARTRRLGRKRAAPRRRDPEAAIAALPLPEVGREYVRSRWLDQLDWMDAKAASARKLYYALRLVTVLGGVAIPALVGLNLEGGVDAAIAWATFGLGLAVAGSAAVEELFGLGDRWRGYRTSAERLKSEGWEFFALAGRYRRFRTHEAAFRAFVARVEGVIRSDLTYFMSEVAAEDDEREKEKDEQP